MCKVIGKELHENVPVARGNKEAGFTQFLTHKSTLSSVVEATVLNGHSKENGKESVLFKQI